MNWTCPEGPAYVALFRRLIRATDWFVDADSYDQVFCCEMSGGVVAVVSRFHHRDALDQKTTYHTIALKAPGQDLPTAIADHNDQQWLAKPGESYDPRKLWPADLYDHAEACAKEYRLRQSRCRITSLISAALGHDAPRRIP